MVVSTIIAYYRSNRLVRPVGVLFTLNRLSYMYFGWHDSVFKKREKK